MPSTPVAINLLAWNSYLDHILRITFFLEEDAALGDDDGHIAIDVALSIIVD